MRGQVTIEFVFLLVVLVTILTVISIPFVNEATAMSLDTGIGFSLLASAERITSAADDLSKAGCGSFKNITVVVEPDPLSEASIVWNSSYVWGEYYLANGTQVKTTALSYPENISISHNCAKSGFNAFHILIEKDCAPSSSVGVIGVHAWMEGCP